MSAAELEGKFLALCSGLGNGKGAALLAKLRTLGELEDVRTLFTL